MKEALQLAKQAAQRGEVPVGAVVVKDGVVIGRGRNGREEKNDVSSHAEMEAIRDAAKTFGDWRLGGCELYVTLEPCAMCCGAILHARLSRVVFGAYDEAAGAVVSKAHLLSGTLAPAPQVIGGLLAAQSEALLQDFFAERRKKADLPLDKQVEKSI
jgi:tRNA(adenine34) deaminase